MPFTAPTWTVLEMSVIGVPAYSTRKAAQTLTPIAQAAGNLYRDVNGILRNAGGSQFQKYATQIQCTDIRPFSSLGVWPGLEISIKCIAMLNYPVGGSPERTPVSGSEITEEGFVHYRPHMLFVVTGFTFSREEYEDETTWTLTAEER